jgi:hypothetical protein
MPDKKTLDKAKKAGDELEPEMAAMDEMPPEGDMEMADAGVLPEEAPEDADAMAGPTETPVDALQAALDSGATSAEDVMSKLGEAGFEVVPAAGGMAEEPEMDMAGPPPEGMPATAGELRERVRGAAARALGGKA